ncbi:hypothetical protein ASD11_09445 [Aeromicrobium sp. Root495]|uniref:hypothetical protein n=1 Tax=Aeromicrobium sp. Root495 TaxID=1736550 RepID=UPI0006F29EB6|nr:hypothetical protein [Aeromicrobium sp. Root495]KQY59752.1 hypothetical protein ASD11_09445 [Aeromicrobium sp. Root495]
MSSLRRTTASALVALTLVAGLGACTGSSKDAGPKSSTGATAPAADDPAAAALAALEKLPEVDLAKVPTPEPADGLARSEIEGYAGQLRRLLADSLENEKWWDADPGLKTARSFLADVSPQTREQYLTSVADRNGQNPASQYLVSIFDEDHQPTGPPRIVKATWRTDRVARDDGSTYERIALQAYAVYRVKDQDQPVVVRRWLQLSGEPDVAGTWPSLANYTLIDGVDTCTLYEQGTYEPVTAGTADAESLRTVLREARSKQWVAFGLPDAEDASPEEKRSSSCADREDS